MLTLDQWRRAEDAPGHLPPDVAAERDACFEFYVRNAHKPGMTLDKAFGASVASGGDAWFVKTAIERRDKALSELAAVLLPVAPIAKRVDAVRLAMVVYRPTWNRRDHSRIAPATDSPKARWLFTAFSEARLSGTDLPDSPSHLHKILSGQVSETIEEPLIFKTSG